MSFLTGGSGGQTSTTNTNSNTSVNYAPWYTQYAQNLLERGQDLASQPFQPYDISKMFAPFQPAQQQAFNQIEANQTAHWPYINAATGALNNIYGLNPAAAGQPFVNAAAQQPGGYQAAMPWLSAGTQTWNPQVQGQYASPFLGGAVDFGNQLATQNFLERTIPGVNAQFVKSGGGLGGKNYADYMGRTVRDFTNNMIGQNQSTMAGNWWNMANQFNQDQNRMMTAGINAGGLANSTMGALGQLGQTAAGIQSTGVNSGINTANAYSGLAGALSNLNNANSQALLQIGNQQQQQAQNPLTAAYQQYLTAQQYPYNQLSWLSNLSSGLRIPSTQNTQSTSTQNVSSNSSPSILGSILGGASSILGMGNVSNWLGGLFGGGGGGVTPSATPNTSGGMNGATWSVPTGNGFGVGSGGYQFPAGSGGFGYGTYRRGGHISKYASGGNVLSPTGDLGGSPGGALARAEPQTEEKPKEPTPSESWSRSGMDANTSAPGYRSGGAIRRYSQGGTVPVIRGVNQRAQPALAALAQRQRPPVPMPRASTGALARAAGPMMPGGALSAAR